MFTPLARLLVEHGVSSPESETLLRAVCVHQAAKAEVARGKKPNISRIALVTGVDRGDVARILESSPGVALAVDTRRHRVNRLLAGWYSDRRFLAGGRPLILPIKTGARNSPSFWSLANRYAPGVYPGLILSELCRVGAAERLQGERVRVRTRRYKAKEFSQEILSEMGTRVRDLLQTMLGNATRTHAGRIIRTVETSTADSEFLPLIRKMLVDRSHAVLSGVQEELSSSRWRRGNSTSRRVRIGLTVFSHEDCSEEDRANETRGSDRASRELPRGSRRRAKHAPG